MEREPQDILNELEEKNIPIYSFSRIETINNCLYEAYRTYILEDKDMAQNNVYAIMGGKIHDVLEKIMNNEATEKDLLPAMNQELEDMDMLGIEFPKGRDGSDSIRQGWIADMTHFCNTYKAPKGKFETETFFLYETPKHHYLQGYIDLTRIRKDGLLEIYDYKTSSMYRGEEIKKHGRQLVLYALGKEQQGYKIKSINWIMLKYCAVSYIGKKRSNSKEESEITKIVERKNLVKELESVIETKLWKSGLDEIDVEIILDDAKRKNEIPEQIVNEFTIKPYVMNYELTDEIRQECNEYIDSTIEMWENLDSSNESQYEHIPFTKTKVIKKKHEDGTEYEENKTTEICFYCYSLCGYTKKCPHFQTYLDTKEESKENDDLW